MFFYKRKKLPGCGACWETLAVKRQWVPLAGCLQCLLLSHHSNNTKLTRAWFSKSLRSSLSGVQCASLTACPTVPSDIQTVTDRHLLCAPAIRPRAPLAQDMSERLTETGGGVASCQNHAAIQPLPPSYRLGTKQLATWEKVMQECSRLQIRFPLACEIEIPYRWYLLKRQVNFYVLVCLK